MVKVDVPWHHQSDLDSKALKLRRVCPLICLRVLRQWRMFVKKQRDALLTFCWSWGSDVQTISKIIHNIKLTRGDFVSLKLSVFWSGSKNSNTRKNMKPLCLCRCNREILKNYRKAESQRESFHQDTFFNEVEKTFPSMIFQSIKTIFSLDNGSPYIYSNEVWHDWYCWVEINCFVLRKNLSLPFVNAGNTYKI